MSSLAIDSDPPRLIRSLRVLGSPGAEGPADAAPLIERAVELDVLKSAITHLAAGTGGVVVLEASAGLGKTALLDLTTRLAADAGCLVRQAAPGPPDRQFPFGVVRALLEAPLRDASEWERAELLGGPAAAAGALLLDGTASPSSDVAIAHSLFWLCAGIADTQPLVLVVDDAQWSDRSSLDALCYLARRIEDLPVLIAVAARADDPDAASGLLSLLGGVRAATVLAPAPLTPTGAIRLIRGRAPDTPIKACLECQRAVDGNPWLLDELSRQIAAHGPKVIEQPEPGATAMTAAARNVVRRRVAELGPRDRAVASTLAVIGDGANGDGATTPAHAIAAIAGVAVGELSTARDALVSAGLLGPGGETFAHRLIAHAISEDLAPTERERLHRKAAWALLDIGAPVDVLAAHLLGCQPQGDPQVSELLLRAASDAAQRGSPHAAATYLERALSERAPGDDRGRMLAELATATFDAGLPDPRTFLRKALHELRGRSSRVDALTRLSALGVVDGNDAATLLLLEQERALESQPDARMAIEAAALDALLTRPERHVERARRAQAVDLSMATDPLIKRVLTAHRAWVATELGTPDASRWAAMARDALEGGSLLGEAWRRSAFHLCVRTLIMTDHIEDADRAIATLREEAMTRGSLRLRAAAAWHAAELALRTGHVSEAERQARLALAAVEDDINVFTSGAVAVLVCTLAERGAFKEAHELLRPDTQSGTTDQRRLEIGVSHARARLWLAEGDFERAYAEASGAGARRAEQGRPNPSWTAWRSTAALALAHLGRREEAAALADAELDLAERFGAPIPIAGALHARAVAEADEGARVALCERAIAILEGESAVLPSVRVRLELGSTLARIGRRVEARKALRPALADADAVGGVLLAKRARRELVATGLRPRQAALAGPAALTPRQRQICELAAAGKGNRAIARQLFLSIKTVETHLAAGFRKLGVNTRLELAAELAG